MTVQARHFIDLSDIVGIRLLCSECGIEVLLPFTGELKVKKFRNCPHCNATWTTNGTSIEPTIEEALRTIRIVADLLHHTPGFSLTLEIKAAKSSASPAPGA
jgi:uncharacterized paraquat-inducible protein A